MILHRPARRFRYLGTMCLLATLLFSTLQSQTVDVNFQNRYYGTTNTIGGRMHVSDGQNTWTFSTHYLQTLPFPVNTALDINTMNERLPEAGDDWFPSHKTHKHYFWNNSIQKFRMFQHENTLSYGGSQDEFALFKEYGKVNLHVNFVDGTQDGDILFRDSWYLTSGVHTQSDGFVTKATTDSDPFIPNGSYLEEASNPGGAFTHQTYDPDNNILPYYSERVPWILSAGQKQLKHEPPTQDLAIGDWVCYGFFGENEGDAVVTWDPYHYSATDYFTRAVDFQDYDVTVNAEYTGHRSSVITFPPTRMNSQRVVARENGANGFVDDDYNLPKFHAAYESQGKIFYIKSTDMGSTWLPEQLVSDYYAEAAQYPCIATTFHSWVDPTNIVGGPPTGSFGTINEYTNVTYIAYVEDGEIVLKSKPNVFSGPDKGVWTEIDRIAVTGSCHPVIACPTTSLAAQLDGEQRSCVMIWEQGTSLKYALYYNDTPVSGHRNGTLVSSTFDLKYPAIDFADGRGQSGSEAGYVVTWNRDGYLYEKYLHLVLAQGNVSLGNNQFLRIPLHLQIKNNVAPSITDRREVYEAVNKNAPVVGRFPNQTPIANPTALNGRYYKPLSSPYPYAITIGQLNPPRKVVAIGTSSSSGSTQITEFLTNSTAADLNPSASRVADVGKYNGYYKNGSDIFTFNGSAGTHDVIKYDPRVNPSVWTTKGQSGYYANMCELGSGRIVDLNSTVGSSPFNFVLNAENLSKTSIVEYPVMKQAYVFNGDSAFAKYGVCMPNLYADGGERKYLEWKPLSDSAILVSSNPGISDYIRTDTFTVHDGDILEYATEMFLYNPDQLNVNFSFVLNFIDAVSEDTLLTEDIPATVLPSDSAWYVLARTDISAIVNENVYMTMSIQDTSAGWYTVASDVAICYSLGMEKHTTDNRSVPTSITLSNFPNPFNPSTDITYGIPEETHVKLTVYDNLGREVKVLANGWKAAGTYTVTFDAADLPSGMYLYRIETAKGSVSKKMMLMK